MLNATKINSQHLEADLSTGAVATIAGNCTRAELEASTGAIINATKLLTTTAEVSASVGAQIDYNARHTTEVSKGLGAQVNNHAR